MRMAAGLCVASIRVRPCANSASAASTAVSVSESRNAFNRYNKEKFYNRPIDVSNQVMDENVRLVVMSGFENAAVAMDYLNRTRKAAPTEIVPWLPAGKCRPSLERRHRMSAALTAHSLRRR